MTSTSTKVILTHTLFISHNLFSPLYIAKSFLTLFQPLRGRKHPMLYPPAQPHQLVSFIQQFIIISLTSSSSSQSLPPPSLSLSLSKLTFYLSSSFFCYLCFIFLSCYHCYKAIIYHFSSFSISIPSSVLSSLLLFPLYSYFSSTFISFSLHLKSSPLYSYFSSSTYIPKPFISFSLHLYSFLLSSYSFSLPRYE